jgi:hypothetical protein
MNDMGADAGLLWRVRVPELLLMRVSAVGPGAGTNGGRYAWDTSGPGGTTEYLSSASVVHKQMDPVELSRDLRLPGSVSPVAASNPFGFVNEGTLLNSTGMGVASGAGAILPMPPYARGTLGLWALLAENPAGAPLPAGRTYNVRLDVAWKSSPWGGPAPGTASNVPVADGTGQGTGLFKSPGGAVPPGLRKPSDLAVSLVYTPGLGTAPPNRGLVLLGIGVEVAVVEGGYALLTQEGLEASEAWRTSHAQPVERLAAMDVWAMAVTKSVAEAVDLSESWALELNPGVAELDAVEVGEAWDLVLNP